MRRAVERRGDAVVWVGAGDVGDGAKDVPVPRTPAQDAGKLHREFLPLDRLAVRV
jgi:hypothetical protein